MSDELKLHQHMADTLPVLGEKEASDQAALKVSEMALHWQLIESAPVNQSVLIFIPNREHYGPGVYRALRPHFGTLRPWQVTGLSFGSDCDDSTQPTHWMPLPASPAPSVERQAEKKTLGEPGGTEAATVPGQMARYAFDDHQMYNVLESAICMFFEYRDHYGKDEDVAKHAAVQEIIEGLDAERFLIESGETIGKPTQICLSEHAPESSNAIEIT